MIALWCYEGKLRANGTMAELRAEFNLPESSLDDIYLALTKEEKVGNMGEFLVNVCHGISKMSKYLRYILNDHFVLVCMFY